MGVDTGQPRRGGTGYVGVDVHRAARISAAAHGGQVLVSETTHALAPDAPVRDLGEHRLRDLTNPQRLYQLTGEGPETTFAPLRTLENRPTNLPVQPTSLIGRERELASVTELCLMARAIASDQARQTEEAAQPYDQAEAIYREVGDERGRDVLAAKLWGAAEAMDETGGYRLGPVERELHDRAVPESRERAGHEAFDRAWAAGRVLSSEQAVALAVENSEAG